MSVRSAKQAGTVMPLASQHPAHGVILAMCATVGPRSPALRMASLERSVPQGATAHWVSDICRRCHGNLCQSTCC